MDRRLQQRYVKLVKAHMRTSTSTAAGPGVLPGCATSAAATQAAWRFFNNEQVSLTALVEPLREAGRIGCAESLAPYALLVHDWCKLDYGHHRSKRDTRQLTHEHDVGYELTTSLLVDAHHGFPLAPLEMHLKTANAVWSSSQHPPQKNDHHLAQLQPVMESVAAWQLSRPVVHVIDREADSLGHFRSWDAAGHKFLVRCDDRRVLWQGEPWLLSKMVEHLDRECLFEEVRELTFQDKSARQEVAEVSVVLHRPHKTRSGGKQRDVSGTPLALRLVVARIVDQEGWILAQWTLLTNMESSAADASQIALWYYWRWRVESFFKLLKSGGQQLESWQQESGDAIARRLLVAAMACVVVWNLQRQETPEATEAKQLLVRLSGRRMKRGVVATAPALLAGYLVLLSIADVLEHTDYNLQDLKKLAAQALPFADSS